VGMLTMKLVQFQQLVMENRLLKLVSPNILQFSWLKVGDSESKLLCSFSGAHLSYFRTQILCSKV